MLDCVRRASRIAVVAATLLGALLPGAAAATPAEQPSSDALAAHSAAVDAGLQSALETYLAGRPGQYGVAVRNLGTGQTALVNADRPFLAASTYKVLVMYRAYQRIAAGSLRLDTPITVTSRDAAINGDDGTIHPGQAVTVGDALEAMITVSDNTAAFALTRAVGGWGAVTSAAGELGMYQTRLRSTYFWTTASDMLTFFQALGSGRLVSGRASSQMVAVLSRQMANDRIPAGLPAGITVAHKTGELAGVRNDVGIVYGAGSPIAIAVLGSGADPASLNETIAGVARLAYAHLAR